MKKFYNITGYANGKKFETSTQSWETAREIMHALFDTGLYVEFKITGLINCIYNTDFAYEKSFGDVNCFKDRLKKFEEEVAEINQIELPF